jgi:hypothetical protein
MTRATLKPPHLASTQLPERWAQSAPAIKAVQVAFDVSEAVLEAVRRAAFASSLSTSDQVRVVLGLEIVRQAKRPRLTISLNTQDYAVLGLRFGLKASDHLAIKERVIAALVQFSQGGQSKTSARGSAKALARQTPPGQTITSVSASPTGVTSAQSSSASQKGES